MIFKKTDVEMFVKGGKRVVKPGFFSISDLKGNNATATVADPTKSNADLSLNTGAMLSGEENFAVANPDSNILHAITVVPRVQTTSSNTTSRKNRQNNYTYDLKSEVPLLDGKWFLYRGQSESKS